MKAGMLPEREEISRGSRKLLIPVDLRYILSQVRSLMNCEYMTGGTVVVLGPTGRNFGAGFSGGNTYVLDLDMKKVNPGAIKSGALLFKSLDAETSKLVYALVKQHAEETGSQFAAALLEDWNETVKRFTHVVPKQFVAMTKAMEEAKANNVDFNAPGAWEKVYEQVMEGAR